MEFNSLFWTLPLYMQWFSIRRHLFLYSLVCLLTHGKACHPEMKWWNILVYGKLPKTWTPWLFNSCRVMTGYACRLQVREIIFCSNISFLCYSIIFFLLSLPSHQLLQRKHSDIKQLGFWLFLSCIYAQDWETSFFFSPFANQVHLR